MLKFTELVGSRAEISLGVARGQMRAWNGKALIRWYNLLVIRW